MTGVLALQLIKRYLTSEAAQNNIRFRLFESPLDKNYLNS